MKALHKAWRTYKVYNPLANREGYVSQPFMSKEKGSSKENVLTVSPSSDVNTFPESKIMQRETGGTM